MEVHQEKSPSRSSWRKDEGLDYSSREVDGQAQVCDRSSSASGCDGSFFSAANVVQLVLIASNCSVLDGNLGIILCHNDQRACQWWSGFPGLWIFGCGFSWSSQLDANICAVAIAGTFATAMSLYEMASM
jgi:hypothetical protein